MTFRIRRFILAFMPVALGFNITACSVDVDEKTDETEVIEFEGESFLEEAVAPRTCVLDEGGTTRTCSGGGGPTITYPCITTSCGF
jgi:hypothetical protein